MSLVGILEDLGLGEILQIVSLSRKSGVLELNSRDRSGMIIFRSGQVIRATATTFPEHLGDLLLRSGKVDIKTLRQALLLQLKQADGRRIGDILVDEFGLTRDDIDKLMREQIERIVYSFFGWIEGSFTFELGEPEELAATTLDPLQFMLDGGLNPQWLAMEGSRLIDEKRLRGEETEERGETLVDVDQLLAELNAGAPAADVAGARKIPAEGARNFPLVDGDPTTAEQMGTPVVRNPRLFNIGVELFHEMGEASGLTPQQTRQSPGLHLLRGMLEELNNPSLGGGIILLILRFASELMNRAVIFLVKEQEIVGLGQFGIELQGESADDIVRHTRIPAREASLFSDALAKMTPIRAAAVSRPWDDYLFTRFGGKRPSEIFLGPLISEGRVVAVLYGDNLPEQTVVGDTEALEIFLSQAGLAMEKALLEQRLINNRAVS